MKLSTFSFVLLASFCCSVVSAQTTVFNHDFENSTAGDLSDATAMADLGTPVAGSLSATGGFLSMTRPAWTSGNNGANNEIIVADGTFNDVGTPAGNFLTATLSEPAAITGDLLPGETTTVSFEIASFGNSGTIGFKYAHIVGLSSAGDEVFHILWRAANGALIREVFAREFGQDNTTVVGGAFDSLEGTLILGGVSFNINDTNTAARPGGIVRVSIELDSNGWNASASPSSGGSPAAGVGEVPATGLGIASGATDLASIQFFSSHNASVTNQNKGLWVDNILVETDRTVEPTQGPTGDFNNDGVTDCADIDSYIGLLSLSAGGNEELDLVADGTITLADVDFLIENLVVTSNGQTGTRRGDLNCDGNVNVLGDAFILVANLNNSVNSYSAGDLNLSGAVDVLGDAFALVANLGFSNTP